MPFQSQKQRAYFYSQLPELAKKWEADTPKKKLPLYKSEGGSIESPLMKYLREKKKI